MFENYHNTYIVNLIDSGDHKLILPAFLFNNKDITERALNNWLTKFTTAQQFRDLLSALNNLENEHIFVDKNGNTKSEVNYSNCLLYTSPSPRDRQKSRMPSSA